MAEYTPKGPGEVGKPGSFHGREIAESHQRPSARPIDIGDKRKASSGREDHPLEVKARYPMAVKPTETKPADTERNVAEILGGKRDFSLGDLNPLLHAPRLTNARAIEALKYVIHNKIDKYEGVSPVRLESTHATSLDGQKQDLRFVARFELDHISDDQMRQLEEVVGQTYGTSVRTRKGTDGKDQPLEFYPPLHIGERVESATRGWYMGPNLAQTDSLHIGLFFFRDYGKVDKDNILSEAVPPSKFIVEIREASLHQTDLVEFVTKVSAILGEKKLPKEGDLLYEIYNDLMRLGLKKVTADSIYGMDDAIDKIRRGLLTPLASIDLSKGIQQDPESALLVGVPGTGKTLVVEQLLNEETGVFILPLDPVQLADELRAPKDKQTILPRIAQVARRTGKRVVLHIDDIENMAQGDKNFESTATHSTLLNLMAGIRDSGFYLIASTNYPEKIDPTLLEPQRFGILIYTGLQDEKARREILKIHATTESERLGLPLFSSDEVRDVILDEVVRHTEYFTPRYLAEIATVAKSHLLNRIATRKDQRIGLTEEDLPGETFTIEDWEQAFVEVASRYNKEGTRLRDEELRKFVTRQRHKIMGFESTLQDGTHRIFSREAYDRVAAYDTFPGEKSDPRTIS